jgi:hypothetical protein
MLLNLTIMRDLGYLVRDGNGWKACPPELPEYIPADTTASGSAVEIGRLYRTGCKHIADALDAMKAQGIIA